MVSRFMVDGGVAVRDDVREEQQSSPEYTVETITPELAKAYLAHNESNRNRKARFVQHLAEAISRGEWKMNGVPIIFDERGRLIDGQHRLQAAVIADTPIQAAVLRGVPMDVQDSLDLGVRRNLADRLAVRGERNTSVLSGAITWLWKFEHYDRTGEPGVINNRRPTVMLGVQVLDENPGLRESVSVAGRVYRANKGTPSGMIAACHYQFASIDNQDAEVFFEHLVTGVGLDEGHPIYALRAALKRLNERKPKPQHHYYAAIIRKAWNAFRRGDEMKQVGYSPGGSRRERFPKLESFQQQLV